MTPANAQTFIGVGIPPAGGSSQIEAISGDGSTLVGIVRFNYNPIAWRWTRTEDGTFSNSPVGTFEGGTTSWASGVNFDGTIVVGVSDLPQSSDSAFLWTQLEDGTSEMINLGSTTNSKSGATGVDGSGTVVVGVVGYFDQIRGFRWTVQQGLSLLDPLESFEISAASDVSEDGRVVIGSSSDQGRSSSRATKWVVHPDGSVAREELEPIAADLSAYVAAISADGTTAVGCCVDSETSWATIWRDPTTPRALSDAGGPPNTCAVATSGDGKVVVGSAFLGDGNAAFVWTPILGIVDLREYLFRLGAGLDGWVLGPASAISQDGRTIAGNGHHNGMSQAWVATIPAFCPADYDGDGDAEVDDIFRFLSLWFANDLRADIDDNGGIAVPDIFAFLSAWFIGCP